MAPQPVAIEPVAIETASPETVSHTVPGLEQPAEIVVDQWGIPHIRANTRRDIFFVASAG